MKRLLTIVLVLGLAGPALAQPDGMSDEGTARLADRAEQKAIGDGAPLAVSEETHPAAREIVGKVDAWLLLMLLSGGFLGEPSS